MTESKGYVEADQHAAETWCEQYNGKKIDASSATVDAVVVPIESETDRHEVAQ